MSYENSNYHRLELSIAMDPHDSRRVMPVVQARHRRILDVGCGAGQTLIGSKLPEHVLAAGVDVDFSALAFGIQMNPAIHFICSRGEALPFKNETFDLVICRVALPYMHIPRALTEMARVAAARADLWLVLHPLSMTVKELGTNVAGLELKASLYRLWVLLNGLTLNTVGRQSAWPGNANRYESWQTQRGMKRALRAAGFDEIRISGDNHFVITATKRTA